MLDYLQNNKEWIFSGIGVLVLGWIIAVLFRQTPASGVSQEQRAGNRATAIQAGRDVIVNAPLNPEPDKSTQVVVSRAALRDQRISRLTREYNRIGTEGLAREIAAMNDLDQSEKAEMFDTVRAQARGGRLPKNNPFRPAGQ